jgi:hypothetical protein
MHVATQLHWGSALVSRISDVLVFARRQDERGDDSGQAKATTREEKVAKRLMDPASAPADEEGVIWTTAEEELLELRRRAGRIALMNTIRRIADIAVAHHVLRRALQAAHHRGVAAAAATSEALAAARAVRCAEAELAVWQLRWKAVWPPCRQSAITTREALSALEQAKEHGEC